MMMELTRDNDEIRAAVETAKSMDWGNLSGTDDDEEVASYCQLVTEPWREEEEEEKRRAAQAGELNVNPAPQKTTTKETYLIKCSSCQSRFTSLDRYIVHRVSHGMEAALLRMPHVDSLLKESPRLGTLVLEEMLQTKLKQGFVPQLCAIAGELLVKVESQEMAEFMKQLCLKLYNVKNKRHAMPSAYLVEYLSNESTVIVDCGLRDSAITILSQVVVGSYEKCALNIFLTNFIRAFSKKLVANILHIIRTGQNSEFIPIENRYATTYQSTETLEFKQNMHYIGGSNVRSVLGKALRIKHKSAEWLRVIDTLRNQFIISEFAAAPDKELMEWTESIDRGGLKKISAKALEFFVQLEREVKPLERLDGSLHNVEVLEKVTNSAHLLLRWDELQGTLSENESLKLLHAMSLQFCVTWRNGILGRRHDQMAEGEVSEKFGTSGVAFRSKLGGS